MSCRASRQVFSVLLLVVAALVFCPAQGTANAETSDAFSQNKRLGRGVNVLGYDPIWKDRQKARFQEKYFRLIKEAGFHQIQDPASSFTSPKWVPFQTLLDKLAEAVRSGPMVIMEYLDSDGETHMFTDDEYRRKLSIDRRNAAMTTNITGESPTGL